LKRDFTAFVFWSGVPGGEQKKKRDQEERNYETNPIIAMQKPRPQDEGF
jgi:hypothetical protein